MKAKINVFSGFLGSGKTTLIRKMVEGGFPGEKLVILENEYGDISIDDKFLKNTGIQISGINSGCICCSMSGDFITSIESITEWMNPDRILVEPSGIGRLSDILGVLNGPCKRFADVMGVVTVVDACKFDLYLKNYQGYYDNQLSNTRCVMLNRTEKLSLETVKRIVDKIHEINPEATIMTTPWNELTPEQIRDAIENKCSLEKMIADMADESDIVCHHHHDHNHEHHHDHDHEHGNDPFDSWGIQTPSKYSRDNLVDMLRLLDNKDEFGEVLRAKGVVPASDGNWLHFDYVPGEIDIREGSSSITGQICVIGTNIDKVRLKELFELRGTL